MIKAIVYTSNTGHTKEYAKLLSKKVGVNAYELKDAINTLEKGIDIVYLGWLMAGKIKGYKKAKEAFNIKALGAVGMGKDESQKDDVIKTNKIEEIPVFYLQGGFEYNKLHGIYKLMMKVLVISAKKGYVSQVNPSPEEEEMFDLVLNGGSRVKEENLDKMVKYLGE